MLDAFFTPKSVAVIGASRDPDKLGHAVVDNLIKSGYTSSHQVYPINPKADEILGLKAYPSVLDVPGEIDLVVLVIPYKFVPAAMRESGEKGVPAAVVITAGFREAGHEGLEREREILSIAKEYGMRVIGPNCLGVIDTYTPLNASFAADELHVPVRCPGHRRARYRPGRTHGLFQVRQPGQQGRRERDRPA